MKAITQKNIISFWIFLIASILIFSNFLYADDTAFRKALADAGVGRTTIDYILKTFTSRNPERVRELAAWIKDYTGEKPGKTIERAPELVGYKIETLEEKVRWLRTQGAEDMGRIIRNQPQIFSKDVTTMDKVVKWLKTQGVENIGRVIERHPGVLAYSISDRLDVVLKWLKKIKIKNIGAVIETNPSLLGSDVDLKLSPIYEWLKDLGVKSPANIIERNANILSYDIDQTLEPIIEWLTTNGVKSDDISKVIERSPNIFDFDIQKNLNPKIAWLKKQGVKKISFVLTNYPQFLGLSFEGNLDDNTRWLTEIGVPAAQVGHVIEQKPQFLGLSVKENLDPKIKWFKSQGIKDVGAMIVRAPALLGYSLEENLIPTWNELMSVWDLTVDEIEGRPRMLGASLDRLRLIAEWAKVAEVDLSVLPSKVKYRIIQSSSLQDIVRNLTHFRDYISERIPEGTARLKALEAVVDRFEENKLTHRYLMNEERFLSSGTASSECYQLLQRIVETHK